MTYASKQASMRIYINICINVTQVVPISSRKTTAGAQNLAASNRHFTIFSLSPLNLEMSDAAEQQKKTELFRSATALANIVFPKIQHHNTTHSTQRIRKQTITRHHTVCCTENNFINTLITTEEKTA
jgi:hypothetical protein